MVYIVVNPLFFQHETPFQHPESPLRGQAILEALDKEGLLKNLLEPRRASEEEILYCHTPEYLKVLKKEVSVCRQGEIRALSTGDAFISPGSYESALWAVGSTLAAVDQVFFEKHSKVFCVLRPPGHHACSDRGMGFCLLNNVAIAARYAQKKSPGLKVLIVDWDVHHGNGTQEIFEQDPSVFYFSTHQANFYPFGCGLEEQKGFGEGKGATCNVPIKGGKGAKEQVLSAFEGLLLEKMEEFRPQIIFISAGFDAHAHDPLGGFDLYEQDFDRLTRGILQLADRFCEGRVVSVLEGGYNLRALASCAVSHVKTLEKKA